MAIKIEYLYIGAAFSSLFLIFSKVSFGFLNWYFKIEGDKILRKNLDGIFIKIHDKSIHYIIQWSLLNLFSRIKDSFKGKFRVISLKVCLVFILVNMISLGIAQFSFLFLEHWNFSESLKNFFYLFFRSPKAIAIAVVVFGMFASIFDLISLKITLFLLKKASQSASLSITLLHIFFDILIATVACFWAITLLSLINPIILYKIEFEVGETVLRTTKAVLTTPQAYIPTIIVGVSAGLPTLCYLCIEIILLTLHFIPKKIYDFFVMIVWKITTDESSVFTQLGKAVGGASALIAVSVSFFKALGVF